MILLPDYEISEVIHDGLVSTVYRGIRKKDRLPVVLKVLKREYPSSDELKAFQRQHELLGNIEIKGIIRTLDLVHYRNTLVLVMEDFSGGPLNLSLPWGGLGLRSLLSLFIKITETLSEIHKKNIIHKDINPQHILFNPVTEDVRLIGFGIATRLSRDIQAVVSPDRLEGTLQYISPEQTGRMNRSIDYRTDYYSLGISLYEIMTGKLPFDSVDAIEIIHGHMAKIPSAPCQINSNVPPALSKIIVKLISKNAEDRYQSAAGLIHDFERCLAELDKHGAVRPSPCVEALITEIQCGQKRRGICMLVTVYTPCSDRCRPGGVGKTP